MRQGRLAGVHLVVDRHPEGMLVTDDRGGTEVVPADGFPAYVAAQEGRSTPPRWVWSDTALWYPPLLRAGVRVERCHDLRLVEAIIAGAEGRAVRSFAARPRAALAMPERQSAALFDLEAEPREAERTPPAAELHAEQLAALARASTRAPGALALLAAAESAGALAAAEMTFTGLPWSAEDHERLLVEALGPRPAAGERPVHLAALAAEVERQLGVRPGSLAIDSPPELVAALRGAGIDVATTRSWELQRQRHPAIAPLLQYKTLSRLMTANGWNWLDEWVRDGRFRPTFVPGGVVTGRWASDGGGALQLPRQVRSAVRADEGWVLVVADAAQLEPRILTALSQDAEMARAGAGVDLYQGIVDSGAVDSREQAKLGMLGAMYGGTTGQSARVLPRLQRVFPRAIAYVEEAARAGERGETVRTRLGRTSPSPGEEWRERQLLAAAEGAGESERRDARTAARGQGRFTRNFVVQGTAAEWALAWMAGVRRRLWSAEGGPLARQPHLVFFLHDELMVHAPAARAEEAATALREAAADAGRLLFGDAPVTFPVTVATVQRYSEAK